MDKKIKEFKKTNGKYILNKSKEQNKGVNIISEKSNKKILEKVEKELQEVLNSEKAISIEKAKEQEAGKNNVTVQKASTEAKEKVENTESQKDTQNVNHSVGNFQLVVVKKLPWYKKAFKALASLFKGFNKKEITVR